MNWITYVQEALRPGGTPKRYLVWVSVILLAQTIASVSITFQGPFFLSIILGSNILLVLFMFYLKDDRYFITSSYLICVWGLFFTTFIIVLDFTSLSNIIFLLAWSSAVTIAERREYFSFRRVFLFMILILFCSSIIIYALKIREAVDLLSLVIGVLLTIINIYLIYIDFDEHKNFFREKRKVYTDLEKLSSKLSKILTAEGEQKYLEKVVKECVPFLGLEDCVIYLFDKEKGKLIQVAAYGEKDGGDGTVVNPIEIKPNEGVVGKCFVNKSTVLVEEVKAYSEYIVDDKKRNSELSVPIFSNGEVIGVIDSEHSVKGFFKRRHEQIFKIIASFCGIKITEQYAKDSIKHIEFVKAERRKYKELNDLKNRFITNISHDLKTPLSLIKAPAMQIAHLTEDTELHQYADYIVKNSEHLHRVVDQLLQLNQMEKGEHLQLKEVDIKQLLNKTAFQYKGLAEELETKLSIQVQASTIITDAFRLGQIIHNLVHNAFRYNDKGGEIHVNVKQDDDILEIVISDDGPGIPTEFREKIFDRFFKINENNHKGTGIGLSLVKEYTESLGGKVSVGGTLGKGAVFTVMIPVKMKIGQQCSIQKTPVETNITHSKPILLIVEDNIDLNEFICSVFKWEFECIPVFDGKQALKKIKKVIPDIIISDLMMPHINGEVLVQEIKENEALSHIPIVVLSAKSDASSKKKLYQMGVDNYLTKPFNTEELKAVVNNLITQRKKLKTAFRSNFLDKNNTKRINEKTELSEADFLLKSALNIVMDNLDNPTLSVKTITEKLGVGRNKLQSEIKKQTELTPVEFIRSIRLNEGKKMLEGTSINISEVAYAVGFNNLSYFTRSFKNEFDILPSEWQLFNTNKAISLENEVI